MWVILRIGKPDYFPAGACGQPGQTHFEEIPAIFGAPVAHDEHPRIPVDTLIPFSCTPCDGPVL